MQGIIDFKTDRQMNEWHDDRLNVKVKNIAILLAFYAWNFFEKKLVITDIYRTQQEQNYVYRDSKKYKQHPWQSCHQYWRAIDIRTHGLSDNEIKILLKIANTIVYNQNRLNKKTALFHKIGSGASHLHCQTYNS